MLYGVMALLEESRGRIPRWLSQLPEHPPGGEFPILAGAGSISAFCRLLATILVWWAMARTTLGFAIRAVGHNPLASAYAGIPVGRIVLLAAIMSGALAGLAGAGEVGGVRYQVTSDLSSGYGYAGIVIATLAELNPLAVVPAALFFAVIFNGASSMARSTGVPVYLADVIQGVALLSMVAGRLFMVYRLRVAHHA
jgi:simple sugar transport system permease protein